MKALRIAAVVLLTAIAGAVLSIFASIYLTELYHVSNFEGGRGMLIFFALAPLGLIVGFIIGLVVQSEGGASQFIKLKLRATPRKEDEAWSDWITATERADLSPVPEPERIAVRYRVQPEE